MRTTLGSIPCLCWLVCALAGLCDDKAGYVSYREHGAVGDGVADDSDAIIRAHDAANKANLPVRADAGATYSIGDTSKSAQIQTDTDWGDATFVIDDTKVNVENRNRNVHIFTVTSRLPATKITSVETLKKNQPKLGLTLERRAFVIVTDSKTLRYIRYGANRNNGTAQTDVFIADKNGDVDKSTPILWDFNAISAMTAYPIDPETLTVKGGRFRTIANQAEPKYNYYARGININRSNVVIDGLHHAPSRVSLTTAHPTADSSRSRPAPTSRCKTVPCRGTRPTARSAPPTPPSRWGRMTSPSTRRTT